MLIFKRKMIVSMDYCRQNSFGNQLLMMMIPVAVIIEFMILW
jgi:hypothetical protein